jgi:hypothetical protein
MTVEICLPVAAIFSSRRSNVARGISLQDSRKAISGFSIYRNRVRSSSAMVSISMSSPAGV